MITMDHYQKELSQIANELCSHDEENNESTCKVSPEFCSNLNVDDWVVVMYEKQIFPGQILEVNEDGVHVNCMKQCLSGRNGFRWPDVKDNIPYAQHQILCKIQPPKPINNRGTLARLSEDFQKAMDMLNQKLIN